MDELYRYDKTKNSVSDDSSGQSEGVTDSVSLMSDQSDDLPFSEDMLYENYVKDDDDDVEPDSPMTNVLLRLDSLLREKINSEVEEFQENLHEVLNQHFQVEQKLLKLSQPTKGAGAEDDCSGTSFVVSTDESYSLTDHLPIKASQEDTNSERSIEAEKNCKLIELFTSASIISSTLRRPEFTT